MMTFLKALVILCDSSYSTILSIRRKSGITPEPISDLFGCNPYSLNLQSCETGDSIGMFARNFDLLIQNKYPNPSLPSKMCQSSPVDTNLILSYE